MNGSVYQGYLALGSLHSSVRLYTSFWLQSPLFRRGSPDSSNQCLKGFCATAGTALNGAIEEVPQSDLEQGFFRHYFLVPKRDGRFERETGLSLSIWKMPVFIFRKFGGTGSSFGSLLEGRLTNTRFLPLAPRTFTKCMDAALALFGFQGIRVLLGRLAHSGPLQGVSDLSQGCRPMPHSCSGPQNEYQEECSLPFSTKCVFGSSLGFRSNAGPSGSCPDFQPQYMFGPLQASHF